MTRHSAIWYGQEISQTYAAQCARLHEEIADEQRANETRQAAAARRQAEQAQRLAHLAALRTAHADRVARGLA